MGVITEESSKGNKLRETYYYIPFDKIPSREEIIKTALKTKEASGVETEMKNKLEKLSNKDIRLIFSSSIVYGIEPFEKKYEDRIIVRETETDLNTGKTKKDFNEREFKGYKKFVRHSEEAKENMNLDVLRNEIDSKKSKRNDAQRDLKDIAKKAKDIETPQTLSSKIEKEAGLPVSRRKELREMVKKNGFRLNQLTKRAQMILRISKGEK